MLKKSAYIIFALFVFNLAASGQKQKKVEYSGFFDSYYYRGPLNVTLGVGTAGYNGDLGFMPGAKLSPAFNAGVSYMVWPRTYFGVDLNYLTLGGEKNDTSGSISFTTNVYEFLAYGRFNLVDKRILFKNDISKRPPRVRPYITLGIGAAYFDPKVTVTDSNFFKKYTAVNTSNVALIIPASFGLSFYINKRFSLLTDFGYRYTFTDGLDGISKLGTSGKDSYATATLKIQYTFHPFKKRRAKYVPPVEGSGTSGGSGGNNVAPAKKDSTLNDPILPPGAPIPEPGKDSSVVPGAEGTGGGQIAPPVTPPAEEKPKELTEEEKRKIQEEKEQLEWENSNKPKPAQPADKKKKAVKKPAQDTGGW